jgi:hypothetical protein
MTSRRSWERECELQTSRETQDPACKLALNGLFVSRRLVVLLFPPPSGSFAVVKRAVRKSDNKQFAIKVIKKSKLNNEELAVVHDEVEIMHKVDTNKTKKARTRRKKLISSQFLCSVVFVVV